MKVNDQHVVVLIWSNCEILFPFYGRLQLLSKLKTVQLWFYSFGTEFPFRFSLREDDIYVREPFVHFIFLSVFA